MQKTLEGKRILVTGGTTGIGRATALLLAEQKARVFVFGRDKGVLQDTLRDAEKLNISLDGCTADVAKQEDVSMVFERIEKEWGGLDVLVNNAAIGAGGVMDHAYEEWEYVLRTNIAGYLHCAQQALKLMQPAKQGDIVLVGSMSAETREEGSDVYVATKAAIQGFSESLRKRVNEQGIRLTLIEPGRVATNMQGLSPEQEMKEEAEQSILMAEDIADAICYCITRPPRVDVVLMQVRPLKQLI